MLTSPPPRATARAVSVAGDRIVRATTDQTCMNARMAQDRDRRTSFSIAAASDHHSGAIAHSRHASYSTTSGGVQAGPCACSSSRRRLTNVLLPAPHCPSTCTTALVLSEFVASSLSSAPRCAARTRRPSPSRTRVESTCAGAGVRGSEPHATGATVTLPSVPPNANRPRPSTSGTVASETTPRPGADSGRPTGSPVRASQQDSLLFVPPEISATRPFGRVTATTAVSAPGPTTIGAPRRAPVLSHRHRTPSLPQLTTIDSPDGNLATVIPHTAPPSLRSDGPSCCAVSASQRRTVPSSPPVTSVGLPSIGRPAVMARTAPAWSPNGSPTGSPVSTSQRRIRPSSPPMNSTAVGPGTVSAVMDHTLPVSDAIAPPVVTPWAPSQSCTVPRLPAVANRICPSGSVTAVIDRITAGSADLASLSSSPLAAFHQAILPSESPAATTTVPSGSVTAVTAQTDPCMRSVHRRGPASCGLSEVT